MQILLVLVLICVPTMLFVKPVYENIQHKKHKADSNDVKEQPLIERQHYAINEGAHNL